LPDRRFPSLLLAFLSLFLAAPFLFQFSVSLATRYRICDLKPCRIEASLGRLRFLQLGSILAPIKRIKSGGFSELVLAESTDSLG
jgi:hypothetical protein